MESMPARIEFDYDRAIDRATQLFWKKGYSRTSLRELLRTMGIGEGSFYNTFRSKKHLFRECLKHYDDTVSQRRLAALLGPATAKEGIRAFFTALLDELDDPNTPALCLLVGSVSADVLSDRELSRQVRRDMEAFLGAFVRRLRSAKEKGELPADFDVEVTAQLILTYLQGMFRVIRVLQNRAHIEQQIESLLSGLGL
jgi:TetR/AcrR family transcriptional repressor of nem operon